MNTRRLLIACALVTAPALRADEPDLVTRTAEHQQGASKLSGEQDELAADVQQLTLEQTVPKVIELLKECEDLMGEASERLAGHDTGGETLAAQTEVIEKIHAAAKARQQQQGGGEAGSAMMDMLERMMGKSPDADQAGQKGNQAGNQAGKGMTGGSDSGNTAAQGGADGKSEDRRVPKAAGTAGKGLPEEFRQALDAYNRGAEKLAK